MASPINLELGFSGSAASQASADVSGQHGAGDVHVSTGGAKQTQTLYIVAGVIAVAAVLLLVLFYGGRR